MAKNKPENAVQENGVTEEQAVQATDTKPVSYPVDYLAANAAHFKVMPEVVIGALVGKESATEEETKTAIKEYLTTPRGEQPEEGEQEAKQ